MSTTLLNSAIALSKDLGDHWASTTTSDGAADGTTLVDTALKAKANDWVTDEAWVMLTEEPTGGATSLYEERKLSSLSNTAGTLTVLAFGEKVVSGIDYQAHRLFSPSEKRLALISAARTTFPWLFAEVRNESKTSGNWLLNGDVEIWALSTYPDYWRVSAVTATATTTAKLFRRGSTSCKLSGAAGYLYQDWTLVDDLKELRGQTATFSAKGWSDTASSLRLSVNDGTTTTYSTYHPGNSAWTDENGGTWYVSANISSTATDVAFRVYRDSATSTDYIDDLRVTCGYYDKVYIGDLSLARTRPHRVSYQYESLRFQEPWNNVRNFRVDSDNYLYLPDVPRDCILRIEGLGYLDYLVSGASSTAWTATIAVDDPQLKILTAEAVLYLHRQMVFPNNTSGDEKLWAEGYKRWMGELETRKSKFSMIAPHVQANWGI